MSNERVHHMYIGYDVLDVYNLIDAKGAHWMSFLEIQNKMRYIYRFKYNFLSNVLRKMSSTLKAPLECHDDVFIYHIRIRF